MAIGSIEHASQPRQPSSSHGTPRFRPEKTGKRLGGGGLKPLTGHVFLPYASPADSPESMLQTSES